MSRPCNWPYLQWTQIYICYMHKNIYIHICETKTFGHLDICGYYRKLYDVVKIVDDHKIADIFSYRPVLGNWINNECQPHIYIYAIEPTGNGNVIISSNAAAVVAIAYVLHFVHMKILLSFKMPTPLSIYTYLYMYVCVYMYIHMLMVLNKD